MNPTLFSELQRLFERTYANVGINLEDCLIDRSRCAHLSRLAGAASRELSDLARTFLRTADDRLYVGIYYSSWLIEQLEKYDPRSGHVATFWRPRDPNVEGPGGFFFGDAEAPGVLTFRAPSNGTYRFSFSPCAMWGAPGAVKICAR